MPDIAKQTASAAIAPGSLPQINPMMDMYRNQLFSPNQPSQQHHQFACSPSDVGCIPTPVPQNINPNIISPQPSNPNITFPQFLQQSQTISPQSYDVQYLNQFLMTQIGRQVTVEFLIGTNTFTSKSGALLAVGTNYILLQEINSDDLIACDFYNIKFVTFFY